MTPQLAAVIVVVAVVVGGSLALGVWLARRTRARREKAEAELLARLGGRLGLDSMRRTVIEATVEGRGVRITRMETSSHLSTWVEVRVRASDLGFDIQPRRSLVVAAPGATLAATGDAEFDERLLAMSPARERLVQILTPEVRRALLEQHAQATPFWWRLQDGALRGEVKGSWGAAGFEARLDAALRVATRLAREIGEA